MIDQQPWEHRDPQRKRWLGSQSIDCETVSDSVEEYALGIADPDLRSTIERHLSNCERCADLVAKFQQVALMLALSVPLAAPRSSAKTGLLQRVASASTMPVAQAEAVYAGDLDIFRTPTLPSSSEVIASVPAPQRSTGTKWWMTYAAPLATLPLLLALGLVGAWGFNNYTKVNNQQEALALQDLQIARLEAQVDDDSNDGLANILTSPSSKRYTMLSDASEGGAQGTLIADPHSTTAVVKVTGLKSDMGTYTVIVQLQNGTMVPSSEFTVDANGEATALIDLGTQVSDLRSIHIRPNTTDTLTDVAVEEQPDVLFVLIPNDIFENSDTQQAP